MLFALQIEQKTKTRDKENRRMQNGHCAPFSSKNWIYLKRTGPDLIATPYIQKDVQPNAFYCRLWGKLVAAPLPWALTKNCQRQKLLFYLNWKCEVFGCGEQCIYGIRCYKNPWSCVHTRIFNNITPTNLLTGRLRCKRLEFHRFFSAPLWEVWKPWDDTPTSRAPIAEITSTFFSFVGNYIHISFITDLKRFLSA